MDNGGRRIDTSLKYVVTFYVDSDSKTVGVYPLYEGGLTKEDVLSTQPVKHELNTEHLEELPY